MQDFRSLDLAAPILDAITGEGYEIPTPIQAESIPPVLAGEDLLGCAQTGTGKTAAFALPILHRLHTQKTNKKRRGPVLPRALVLSPTRELATQIAESFQVYGKHLGMRGVVIFGGVSQAKQVRSLRSGVDIIVATPGRLIDLMEQGHVDLSAIEMFVLDEADRMLDMGFIHPIKRISSEIHTKRQTLLFSATMPSDIEKLASSLLRNPVKISVTPVASAAPSIEQALYMVSRNVKSELLGRLLAEDDIQRALVFTRTKHGADKLTKWLNREGVTAQSIHGNKSQNQRQKALDIFRSGRSRVLVATDVAARGLDVDGITHVFNYNIPNEPESYVHRIGRTGRAGATGLAVSFCDRDERSYLRAIERLTEMELTPFDVPEDISTERIEKLAPSKFKRSTGRQQRSKPQRSSNRSGPHRTSEGNSKRTNSHKKSSSKGPARSIGNKKSEKSGPNTGKPRKKSAGPQSRSARKKSTQARQSAS